MSRPRSYKDVTTAAGLPVAAAVELLADPAAVAIARAGCSGYWLITIAADKYSADAMRASINAALGVTPAQAAAISAGSMFGWTCPAADPASYDDAGNMRRQSETAEG